MRIDFPQHRPLPLDSGCTQDYFGALGDCHGSNPRRHLPGTAAGRALAQPMAQVTRAFDLVETRPARTPAQVACPGPLADGAAHRLFVAHGPNPIGIRTTSQSFPVRGSTTPKSTNLQQFC
jgi:hypothetical protein